MGYELVSLSWSSQMYQQPNGNLTKMSAMPFRTCTTPSNITFLGLSNIHSTSDDFPETSTSFVSFHRQSKAPSIFQLHGVQITDPTLESSHIEIFYCSELFSLDSTLLRGGSIEVEERFTDQMRRSLEGRTHTSKRWTVHKAF